ncbi:serine/threonine protein kinase [Nocardia huaxiensis]|uniref:non-specific serine/threonine protein kinase n=1 Tax=Nocardia huaxiensis TaxID=2755382 RepID=A0A7D6VHA1_9NOCA|nr:serine/threonine protein kinase [Nocardia huaxiensis]
MRPGTIFAGYRILRILGKGGMGTVYLARHPRIGRDDALKLLSPVLSADPEYRARFHREAELAARLDHPNTVAVWDRGMDEGRLWIAMQYVDGSDAGDLLARHPRGVEVDTALHIIGAAARGLDAAHRAGMLHRDVKPENLLLQHTPGRPDRVYVSDFGIAKAVGETAMLTSPGIVVATLAYASPEQIEADALDHRTDVYALGCTLFELLTGTTPFTGRSGAEIMTAHLVAEVPRVSERKPGLPPALDAVFERALSKDPARRFASCGALAAAALHACHPDEFAAVPEESPVRGQRSTRRLLAAGVTAAVVLAAALVAKVTVGEKESESPSAPPSVTSAVATSTSAVTWGSYDYMAQAFPSLLPSTPFSAGYQGIRCATVDDDQESVVPADPPSAVTRLMCRGDGNPLRYLLVQCRSDRSLNVVAADRESAIQGDERWSRASGSGRIIWGTGEFDGITSGVVQLGFDDSARNFCQLYAVGGATGQQLKDEWWPQAPI